jgi:hypothetical protein
MTSASVSGRSASESARSKASNEISIEAAISKNVLWAEIRRVYDSRASGSGQMRSQRQVQDKDPEGSMHRYMHSGMFRAPNRTNWKPKNQSATVEYFQQGKSLGKD